MKTLDLYLIPYTHEIHFSSFWPIFTKYWLDVNGENLNRLVTLEDGSVGNMAEEKLKEIFAEGHRIKLALVMGQPIAGFVHFRDHGNGELFIHSLYVRPELRGRGIAGQFLKSFRGFSNVLFHTHVDTPPNEFLEVIDNITELGPSSNPRLKLWRGTIRE